MREISIFRAGAPRSQRGGPNHPRMSESGPLADAGTDISMQEAVDLLHKLRAESNPVQAIFVCPSGVGSALRGVLRSPVDNKLWSVASVKEGAGSALSFDLSLAVVRKFGDEHSMRGDAAFPFRLHFESALSFAFTDGSTLALFELKEGRTTVDS